MACNMKTVGFLHVADTTDEFYTELLPDLARVIKVERSNRHVFITYYATKPDNIKTVYIPQEG